MSYQHREHGGYERRYDNRGPPAGGRYDDRRGGGGNDYENRRDDRNGGGGHGRNPGRDGGGYGRGGYGRDGGGGGGGGYGRGGGGYGRDGGGRFPGQRGSSRNYGNDSYNEGNSGAGGGWDSRKRPANGGHEELEPPPSKQKRGIGPITVEVKAKINGQAAKLTHKDGISAISELCEIIVIGDVEVGELTNEVALFLGNAAKFLSGKGASVFSSPGINLVGGKILNSISSALFGNCAFLQMTGDHLQMLMSPACERIDELHVELGFTLLDLTSFECKTLTKWLLGKKAKKSSKKLLVRPRSRDFTARWVCSMQSDRLDNLYQVCIQCEFSLDTFLMSCGSSENMALELSQEGPREYLLSKYPMGEQKPANHAFQLKGPVTKVSFVEQQKP